ncbi:MAG: phosphohydrolase [Alphaproteobacteria bacterium CG_4_10_14_0_2_um_filter_63_37]|nr:MAG: phosphohydrolase [Proteobacteria bacterium CG1_02_64_396]PJA24718.1 MAG: phosphohydrolase [Alphaproteobacteria bacterium CG_4_10_14_0_2_um_filter_63_37]
MKEHAVKEAFEILHQYTHGLAEALKQRDPYTRLHCDRVVELALELGRSAAIPTADMLLLRIAASFHDIGKIGIPDRVLLKAGRLEDEEWALMKSHSVRGEQILLATGLEGVEAVGKVIRHHHEHFDGGGYPDGLMADEIPMAARILGIADSYDAMATTRVYQPQQAHETIMGIMAVEQGGKHDPELFAHFCRVIEDSHYRVR